MSKSNSVQSAIALSFPRGFNSTVASIVTLFLLLLAVVSNAAEPLSTWHVRTSPYGSTNDWKAVAFGNGRFVAVGSIQGLAMTSTNGTDWTAQSANTNKAFYGLAFGNGKFVAVGSSGIVMTSTDGASWQPRNSGTSAHLYGVRYNNDRFVAVGASGAIISSTDGVTWNSHNTGTTNKWEATAYGNGVHVVVGYRSASPGTLTRSAASPTLSNWDVRDTGTSMYLSGVAFGLGRFAACGYNGTMQTSTNGVDWEAATSPAGTWLYNATFANNTFVAVGENGVIRVSTNGTVWSTVRNGSGQVLEGAAFGNNTWVAVGHDGLILQSSPVTTQNGGTLTLTDATCLNGQFSFKFNGTPGQSYVIEASTNLTSWSTLTTILCTNSPMNCTLSGQTAPRRFYRVKQM
jgi:Uncharacterized protein related to plant photosystem II stability/assembly factor